MSFLADFVWNRTLFNLCCNPRTAVSKHVLPGHPPAVIAGQEQHNGGHILIRIADPLERIVLESNLRPLLNFLGLFAQICFGIIGKAAGADGVDAEKAKRKEKTL